jgi:hypothetical protein
MPRLPTPASIEASPAAARPIVLHVALNTLTNDVNVVAKTEIDFPVVTAKAA